jgi:DNA-binding transcriptional LysR family regulator
MTNLPIDLLHSFVVVAKADTLAQAAGSLGLAPAEVIAQLRQLEETLGRKLFDGSGARIRLSEHGKIVSSYAERMLSVNDQIFSQRDSTQNVRKIRVGLPRWVMEKNLLEIVRCCADEVGKDRVCLRCDHLEHLMRDLSAGQLEIALLCNVADPPGVMVKEWWEDMYWVKSPKLVLAPGAQIPIVSWPGSMSDRLISEALDASGIEYATSFTASDMSTRVAAVAAGLGVMAVPERVIGPDVCIATEDFLPQLPRTRKGLYIRDDLNLASVKPVVRLLEACIRPASSNVVTALFAGRRAEPLQTST